MSAGTRKSDTHEEWYAHFKVDHPRATHVTIFARRPGPNHDWQSTYALCAPGDQFSRKVGRQVARRRFFREPSEHLRFDSTLSGSSLYAAVEDAVYRALLIY